MKIKNILFLHVRMHSSIENEYWDSYMKAIDSWIYVNIVDTKTRTFYADFFSLSSYACGVRYPILL